MVKMCLFYDRPSGHARSDPIISQECASSHVHTFYGPRSFHPSTSYEDLLSTPGSMNTSPFVENKSLYWHPSIVSSDTAEIASACYRLSYLISNTFLQITLSLSLCDNSIKLLRMERILELTILNLDHTTDGIGAFRLELSHFPQGSE